MAWNVKLTLPRRRTHLLSSAKGRCKAMLDEYLGSMMWKELRP